jgi:hypothetical protein
LHWLTGARIKVNDTQPTMRKTNARRNIYPYTLSIRPTVRHLARHVRQELASRLWTREGSKPQFTGYSAHTKLL